MITILMIKIIEFVTRGYHRTLRFIESDSPILPVLNRSFAQFVCPAVAPELTGAAGYKRGKGDYANTIFHACCYCRAPAYYDAGRPLFIAYPNKRVTYKTELKTN
jgi:hypothetical protein